LSPVGGLWPKLLAAAQEGDVEIVKMAVAPVDDQYGSFAGEFYVSGTVEIDVNAESATMKKSETVESYDESEVAL